MKNYGNSSKYINLANDTIKEVENREKEISPKRLSKMQENSENEIKVMLKNEIKNENEDARTIDPYDNTPSRSVSKTRTFALTNGAYTNKLLEQLVQGQNSEEHIKSTLQYQESSLKLLESINEKITQLATPKVEGGTEMVSLEREISDLAKSIAELNIPGLYKEMKKTALKSIDKTGMIQNATMIFGMMTEMMADGGLSSTIKSTVKNKTLTSLLGKDGKFMLDKFTESPENLIQDLINMGGLSKTPLLRNMFKSNIKTTKIKEPEKERKDLNQQALFDKLTHVTINHRIPETLDKILEALTGEETLSYDAKTNTRMSKAQKVKQMYESGEIFNLQKGIDDVIRDIKDKIEEDMSANPNKSNHYRGLVKMDSKGKAVTNNGKLQLEDEDMVSTVIHRMIKNGGDLKMLANSNMSPEQFMKEYNLRQGNESKARVIYAITMLQRAMSVRGGMDTVYDISESIEDLKTRASNQSRHNPELGFISPKLTNAVQQVMTGSMTEAQLNAIIAEEEASKKRKGSPLLRNLNLGGYGQPSIATPSTGRKIKSLATEAHYASTGFKQSPSAYGVEMIYDPVTQQVVPKQRLDYSNREEGTKFLKPGKTAYNTAVDTASKTKSQELMDRVNFQLANGMLDPKYASTLTGDRISNTVIKTLDRNDLRYEKALEIFNWFMSAELTAQQLESKTGLPYAVHVNAGYPGVPMDLYKYIKISTDEKGVQYAEVDYTRISGLKIKMDKKYLESLEKDYKNSVKGTEFDILSPEKSMSKILNESFSDPQFTKKMGIGAGSAAGVMIGKLLQEKGIVSSPKAAYILGGIGGAIMNMESMQKRVNAILGPEGSIKNELGYSNREVFVAKMMSKWMPTLGIGGKVGGTIYKMLAQHGWAGKGAGILLGAPLGLISGYLGTKMIDASRNSLFGDDGEGNKGIIKGIGNMLRNVPIINKYLASTKKSGHSDRDIIDFSIMDLQMEVQNEINSITDSVGGDTKLLSDEDNKRLKMLFNINNGLTDVQQRLRSGDEKFAKKEGETDEAYRERILNEIMTQATFKKGVAKVVRDEHVNKLRTSVEKRIEDRERFRDLEKDPSNMDLNFNVREDFFNKELGNIEDEEVRKVLKSVMDDNEGTASEQKMVLAIREILDPDNKLSESKKARENYFRDLMNDPDSDAADSSLSMVLTEEMRNAVKSGDNKKLVELISKSGNKEEILSAIASVGHLNDYQNEISNSEKYLRAMATIQAKMTNPNPSEKDIDTIYFRLLKEYGALSMGDKTEGFIKNKLSGFRKGIANITGEVVMDSDEVGEEADLVDMMNSNNFRTDKSLQAMLKEYEEELADKAQANLDEALKNEEESGKGSGRTTMNDMSKYKFKSGESLGTAGCSIASLNNMLVSMGIGNASIDLLIEVANKHLSKDGSVSATFFKDIADRFGMKLSTYSKKDNSLNEDVVKKEKPSKSKGIILLKNNPGKSYGHFVHLKTSTKLDDPERRALLDVTSADILMISDLYLVFEKASVGKSITSKMVSAIKDKTGIDVTKSISENVSDRLSQAKSSIADSIKSKMGMEDSGTKVVDSSMENLIKVLEGVTVNVRIVDDITLPLRMTDGKVAQRLAMKYGSSNRGAATADYSKQIKNLVNDPTIKSEFETADAVQNAILSGYGGKGTGGMALSPEDLASMMSQQNQDKEGGGWLQSLAGGALTTFAMSKGGKFLTKMMGKSKLGQKVLGSKLGTKIFGKFMQEGAESGVKIVGKELGEKVTETAIKEGASSPKLMSKAMGALGKVGPKLVDFLTKCIGKLPTFAQGFANKLLSKIVTLCGKLVPAMQKFVGSFMKSSAKSGGKGIIKEIGGKLGPVTLIIALGSFVMGFATGYKDAPKLLNAKEEELDLWKKICTAFGYGASVSLPSLILGFIPGGGMIGTAIEIFMGTVGFKMMMEVLLDTEDAPEGNTTDINNQMDQNEKLADDEKAKPDESLKNMTNQKEKNELDKANESQAVKEYNEGSGDPETKDLIKSLGDKAAGTKLTDLLNETSTGSTSYLTTSFPSAYESSTDSMINGPTKPKNDESAKNLDNNAAIADNILSKEAKSEAANTHSNFFKPLGKDSIITSAFGPRNIPGGSNPHKGIDLAGAHGAPIYAVKDGKVITSSSRYGVIAIKHPDGTVSRYLHCSRRLVSVGDTIRAGQVIGAVGGTGASGKKSYADHLHFELLNKSGNPIDPTKEMNLDPNLFKLSPKSKSEENIAYLKRNSSLLARLNDSNKVKLGIAAGDKTVDTNAKGGDNVDSSSFADNTFTKELGSTLSKLNMSISSLGTKDPVSPADVASVKLLGEVKTGMNLLAEIMAVQVELSKKTLEVLTSMQGDSSSFNREVQGMSRSGI
ncbi:MAG: M23 family metallopeptidase [Peptostreptococcaceae bacterium]